MKILTYNARIKKGLSLEQLSEKTGISKSTLNNFENQATFPTLHQIELIAIALDVKISELFESDYK